LLPDSIHGLLARRAVSWGHPMARSLSSLASLFLGTSACGGTAPNPSPPAVASIVITPHASTLVAGTNGRKRRKVIYHWQRLAGDFDSGQPTRLNRFALEASMASRKRIIQLTVKLPSCPVKPQPTILKLACVGTISTGGCILGTVCTKGPRFKRGDPAIRLRRLIKDLDARLGRANGAIKRSGLAGGR
jgi:hypothetical protein